MKHEFNIGDRVRIEGHDYLGDFIIKVKFSQDNQPLTVVYSELGRGCHIFPEEKLLPYFSPVFKVGDTVEIFATGATGKIIGVEETALGKVFVVNLDGVINTFYPNCLRLLSEEVKPKFKVGNIVTYNGDLGIILRRPSLSPLSNNWVIRLLEHGYNETLAENLLTLIR